MIETMAMFAETALEKEGYRRSATSAKELIGMIHNILHNQPRNRLK